MGNEGRPDDAAPPAEQDHARAELADAPPFLSWRVIYLIVLGALAAEVAIGAVVTGLYR